MAQPIPQRLGKYPITGVIGRGAMGVVYRGVDPVIKRAVAIKTIRRELIEGDEHTEAMSDRFRREAQAAGALSHPGIVAVYEYGEDAQHAFIAMEYVEGNSLREYLARDTSFDERDSVSVMAQLLDALQFAHDHSVWHRDIKPANIMVMSNGRIKLTDFGIARIESSDFTKTNVVMGTPGFIAPELYLGREIDQRVDIFSAGVLFYHLLAGRPPFSGRPEAVMHDVCYHDPPPPSSIDAQRSWPQYDAVVARALEKLPDSRYASAAEFRSAILAAYAQPLHNTLSDATIIPATRKAAAGGSPSQAQGTPAPSGVPAGSTPAPSGAIATSTPVASGTSGTSTPPPTGWSAPVLAGVEVTLAHFVGPVARALVRRAAQTCKDIPSLTVALLPSIQQPEDQDAFVNAVTGGPLAALRTRVGMDQTLAGAIPPAAGPAVAGQDPPLTPAELDHATRVLTQYIGPIARVVTKRAAAGGASRREFLHQVAQTLDTDAKRERFLREATIPGV
jgi:eukaryotic-like serine/threonine-protein kinase